MKYVGTITKLPSSKFDITVGGTAATIPNSRARWKVTSKTFIYDFSLSLRMA